MARYSDKLGDSDQINKDLSWTKTHVQFFSKRSKVYYLHNPANTQIKKEKKHQTANTHKVINSTNHTLIIERENLEGISVTFITLICCAVW